jgi:CHASE3 domain sensor protein
MNPISLYFFLMIFIILLVNGIVSLIHSNKVNESTRQDLVNELRGV